MNIKERVWDKTVLCSWEHFEDEYGRFVDATLEEVREEIMKHKNCQEFHKINGKKATCLDMILMELKK